MLIEALQWIPANWPTVWTALQQHLLMSAVALGIALVAGIPLGIVVTRSPRAAALAIGAVNALRTIPSIAILAAALPILGIGFAPSVAALVVLAMPPILLNTYVGLSEVDPEVVDAATGMGMTARQTMWRIQIPLAAPAIFAGARTAAIQVISGATLASFIGGGGLGDFVTAGIAIMDMRRVLAGAIPIALLALGVEVGLALTERWIFGKPRRMP
ncbi:ABC transporter permease [Arenibaculum pallidiluteum]|uniref:ABC transporter permease n=1 Tax=Arenibaculum pallidiluteum TaxID=2812559 RepID=UPI001A9643D8|nr:ABC transporter permease [Arenibaculum pallidiluteum]